MFDKIGVFVAWPYANGDLHLGHIAGAYLPADIFARYHRLKGNDVLMVSGSDAHGTPITLKAKDEGTDPYSVVKRYHQRFLEGWTKLGITFDLFTHTHTQNHIELSKEIFLKLHGQDDLEIKTEEQFYDEQAKVFLPDRYVKGNCPFCNNDRARGDQCEACGKTYETKTLKNPISTISNTTPVLRETSHFYFKLQNYTTQALEYVKKQDHWRAHVKNFTEAMLADGLNSRPITRDIDWGVPVPVKGWENKVMYVWFDAVIGYLSASREWGKRTGKDWESWWKDSKAKSYYFIGKDNIPFHTVIWPIELMAYDSTLNLPYDVPANQFLNIEGEKFSTSRGTAVWLLDFLEKVDSDALRFYLCGIFPETKDANFSSEEMLARNNGELVAAWGNLVNRVLNFAYSRFDGKVPQPNALDAQDHELLDKIEKGLAIVGDLYEKVSLRDALKETLTLTREVNKYLDAKAPWTAFKTDPSAAGTSVYVAMRAIDTLKIMFAPILPKSCEKIHSWFGYPEPLFGEQILEKAEDPDHEVLTYKQVQAKCLFNFSDLKPGTSFGKPEPLFKLLE